MSRSALRSLVVALVLVNVWLAALISWTSGPTYLAFFGVLCGLAAVLGYLVLYVEGTRS